MDGENLEHTSERAGRKKLRWWRKEMQKGLFTRGEEENVDALLF